MKKSIFRKLFENSKLQSLKLDSYFNTYESIFDEFRKKPITFVEVGIFGGGSLFMWKKYFHPKSRIIGIDLNPKAKEYEKYGFEIFIGDQENPKFWKKFYNKVGKIDILLDDGGHTDLQQIQTLISSINKIKKNGIIVVEDVHASYLTEFGNPSTSSFINFSKKIVDLINSRFSGLNKLNKSKNEIKNLIKKNIYSINFYESIVVFKINKKKSIISKVVWNKKKVKQINDYRYENNKNLIWSYAINIKDKFPKFLFNIYFIKLISTNIIKFLINRKKIKKLKKFNI